MTKKSKKKDKRSIQKTNFRFHPNILRRLGEELNLTPSEGIIELVKNSYDADALECTVELIDTKEPGGTVLIKDTGVGMAAKDIKNLWLVLGLSEKSQSKPTKLGRIQAGNKGLGQLAALRLGNKVKLTSIHEKKLLNEYFIEIDWDRFNNIDIVEDVKLELYSTTHDNEKKQGTEIEIENLRFGITRPEAKRLARSIILLAGPFGDSPTGFKPKLKAPEYEDLEELVDVQYFRDAEYHLSAEINTKGFASAKVLDWKGDLLYEASHEDIRRKKKEKPYGCPSCQFDFWAFILNQLTFSTRSTTLEEVKEWLKEYGGVHIYYNGLRVAPYGDKEDDWVGINKLRVKSPEERPASYNSIGRIDIRDKKNVFTQKTDRSGFIIDDTFLELKEFTVDVLEWMARRRLADAEIRRAKARKDATDVSNKAKESVKKAIAKLPDEYRESFDKSFKEFADKAEDEKKQLLKEVQLYRTLATVGITSAVFAHESANNPLKIIRQSIETVKTRAIKYFKDIYYEKFEKTIERIIRSAGSLSVLANVTLSLVDHEKRRASRINIHQVIYDLIELYQPFIIERKVLVTSEFDQGNPYLRGSIAALESIISNLLNNSLTIFEEKSSGERKIKIKTIINGDSIEITVLDNGPGIAGIDKKDIWLPGETTKKNGTGLGLTIVRDAVSDLSGSVDVKEKGEMGGAEFMIELPLIGA